MIAFDRAMIVTGSPPCTAFSQFQHVSWFPKWEKWQATKLLHVAMDVFEDKFEQVVTFSMNPSWEHHQVGPSCVRIAKEERCFYCIITSVLFPSDRRNEGQFEKCHQVCVQINQVGDELEGIGQLRARDVQIATNHHFTGTSC